MDIVIPVQVINTRKMTMHVFLTIVILPRFYKWMENVHHVPITHIKMMTFHARRMNVIYNKSFRLMAHVNNALIMPIILGVIVSLTLVAIGKS